MIAKTAISLEKLVDMHQTLAKEPVLPYYLNKLEDFKNGLFNIVVLGEVKKGKSSFVNALLGIENLVPVGTGIATSAVFRVTYGENITYTVHFLPSVDKDAPDKEPLVIQPSEVADYGTEKGNPENEKRVDYISITCPSDFLKSGFCLIDTPGLGGMFRAHRTITYSYISQADAVFFVSDSSAPLGELECQYIKDVLDVTSQLFFVLTKVNSVSEQAAQWRKENNIGILCDRFPKFAQRANLPYFMLDCGNFFSPDIDDDELMESGYPGLYDFCIGTLLPEKNKLAIRRQAELWAPILQRCRDLLSDRTVLLETESKDELENLVNEANKAKADFISWEEDLQRKYLGPLKRALDVCHQHAMTEASAIGIGGALYMEITKMINGCESIDAVTALLSGEGTETPLMDSFLAKLRTIYSGIITDYATDLRKKISELTDADTSKNLLITGASLSDNRIKNLFKPMEDNVTGAKVFEQIRGTSMGMTCGSSAGAVIGAIIGSVVPVIGTAAGGFIGGGLGAIWGGTQGRIGVTEANLKQHKQSLIAVISNCVNVASGEISRSIAQMHSSVCLDATTSVNEYLKKKKQDLQTMVQELQKRTQLGAKELQEAKAQLAAQKRIFNEILLSLSAS